MTSFVKLLVIATLTLSASTAFNSQDYQSGKKAFVRTGQEATVSGRVSFTGEAPMARTIDTSSDEACQAASPKMKTEDIVVVDGALTNVLVYVVNPQLDDYTFESTQSPATLDHNGCRYVPRIMAIRVGQTLQVLNSDQTPHNTHPSTRQNPAWNQSQAIGSPPIEKTFDRPEIAIRFGDNMHPWERAYVSVFSHPFFAMSDATGNYKIEGLPPGTYKVIAWHETLGTQTEEVVVKPGEAKVMSFSFSEANLKRPDKSAAVAN